MSAFRRTPKTDNTKVKEFINGAERRNEEPQADEGPLPWEAPGIRDDLIKAFNLRISEPYLLKLRFISENTPASMQGFIQKVLFPSIDQEIGRILKRKREERE